MNRNGIFLDRRTLMQGTAAATGALMLPGVALAQNTPRKGGTLRVTIPYNPAAVDPMTGRNAPDFNVLYAVFDALIDFHPQTLELKPGLAKAWKFTDPKTLVLDLVEGVTFHDGTPFNAEAVKFNLERYKNDPRSNVKADLGAVEKIDVTGPSQVTLRLSKPNSGLPTILTTRIGCMVSPKSVQEKGPNIDRTPVGTGPFKFVSWTDNDVIKVVRNENYWKKGQPYLDGIDFRIVNELNTAARTAIVGEADLVLQMQAQQKAIAERSSAVTVTVGPSLNFYGAFLNYGRPPLDDVRVRQAMNYAINRDEINKVIALGLGQPSSGILSKEHWAYDPSTANYYTFDLDKAKKLLAEAGHPNGLDVEAYGWSDQAAMQRQEQLISQLGKAGFRIKMTPIGPGPAMQAFMIEKKAAMLFSPTGGYPDPSQFYDALFAKDALRNAGKIELPGYRELVDATMEASDQGARKAAFAKLQKFVIENALQLPQFVSPNIMIVTKRVQNLSDSITNTPKFQEVWLSAAA
ncbi:MAG TPA: ABC transporter substrate-binding protein [Xanthobacteraceae bacterium]|jgi:peptide/nickel transport system substrate-binding protein/glutathione transport system substrate-binding protein|nr:ABC transporter substrate-binding protein [Xanthobacteraceae bacterium]